MTRRSPYKINEGKGRSMWRSLEDKNRGDEPRDLEAEKPGGFVGEGNLVDPQSMVSRRAFVQGSTLSALAAGAAGCIRRPVDEILPFSQAPEHVIPGVPSQYATSFSVGRDALGLLATSHDGRPTKIEGNGLHPASRGATNVYAQSIVWDLYDPDRSKSPAMRDDGALVDIDLAQFERVLSETATKHKADQGAGLVILSEVRNSPSFRRMRSKVTAKFPKAKFHHYSSINDDNAIKGATIAFGKSVHAVPDFRNARVMLSLDADFLGDAPGAVAAGRGFGPTRAMSSADAPMSRLYVVESNHSITGATADHRLRLPSSRIGAYAAALARALQFKSGGLGQVAGALKGDIKDIPAPWIDAVATDLLENRGRAIVFAGSNQPPHVHALVHAINAALGNVGRTVKYVDVPEADAESSVDAVRSAAAAMKRASTVMILGGNPVYDAPADLKFAEALGRDGLTSIHLSSHRNETSELCTLHVNEAHPLEAWGDCQSLDGTVAPQQPLIAPLYGGLSAIEVLARFAGDKETTGYDIVRATHVSGPLSAIGFEAGWRRALHHGVLRAGRATAAPALNPASIAKALSAVKPAKAPSASNLEVTYIPDPALYDGRYANNLWSLEVPSPMTKIVWDNAALVSQATRDALGLKNGQMVKLSRGEQAIEIAVWAVPGHADWSVTLPLGWGRTSAGRYGNGAGFDVQKLRASDAFFIADGVKLEPLNKTYRIVQTQEHDKMEGRPIAIDATLQEYKEEPDFASYRTVEFSSTPPLWKEVDYSEGYQWGMTIDLSACTGCNACVVACQSENNIPSVGKREVERGREMSWIRIDRYFVGDDDDNPDVALQPVACQQCEEAPCENVCPVNATTHSPEGLNDMAYNRCIGTRYCANNCPYKVRRFNYLDWNTYLEDKWRVYGNFAESRKLQFNPNVTVRMRGVMEKCTYCVQRIQSAKINARREGRKLRDGDVVTACQAACATGAIVFGDLNNKRSRVARLAKTDRRYKLLAEVGAQPRTTYLAKIRNVNPAMKEAKA